MGGVACRRDSSWQPLLPTSVELAFLLGSVTPELFGCSCSELGDKSRQTEEKFPPRSGGPSLPPRDPQAAPPGGVPHYASGHPQVPRSGAP